MDRVRLGRALGRGARLAAKTAYEAVDAATSPTPQVRASAAKATPPAEPVQGSRPAQSGAEPFQQAIRNAGRVHGSMQQARRGVLAPVKRASRALSLEISGSFFALFALSFAVAVWKAHTRARPASARELLLLSGIALVFAYFAASNFVKAHRIGRER